MPTIESLLTVPQTAKLAAVSTRTIWAFLAAGRMPEPIRLGRAVRFRASDIDLWLRLGCPDRASYEAERGKAVAS